MRRWVWIGALGVTAMFALVGAHYGYTASAGLGERPIVKSILWALHVVAAIGAGLGIVTTLKARSQALVVKVLNSLGGRIATIVAGLALGTVGFVVGAIAPPPSTVAWTCTIAVSPRALAVDRSRCGGRATTFVQMRVFALELHVATALDTKLDASVGNDGTVAMYPSASPSARCQAAEPDADGRGRTSVALVPECGLDETYRFAIDVCDTTTLATTFTDVSLAITQANDRKTLRCTITSRDPIPSPIDAAIDAPDDGPPVDPTAASCPQRTDLPPHDRAWLYVVTPTSPHAPDDPDVFVRTQGTPAPGIKADRTGTCATAAYDLGAPKVTITATLFGYDTHNPDFTPTACTADSPCRIDLPRTLPDRFFDTSGRLKKVAALAPSDRPALAAAAGKDAFTRARVLNTTVDAELQRWATKTDITPAQAVNAHLRCAHAPCPPGNPAIDDPNATDWMRRHPHALDHLAPP